MILCEDDRYELDMLIELNVSGPPHHPSSPRYKSDARISPRLPAPPPPLPLPQPQPASGQVAALASIGAKIAVLEAVEGARERAPGSGARRALQAEVERDLGDDAPAGEAGGDAVARPAGGESGEGGQERSGDAPPADKDRADKAEKRPAPGPPPSPEEVDAASRLEPRCAPRAPRRAAWLRAPPPRAGARRADAICLYAHVGQVHEDRADALL
jgi:hypothetical protein